MAINGAVFNVTPYMDYHPGGWDELGYFTRTYPFICDDNQLYYSFVFIKITNVIMLNMFFKYERNQSKVTKNQSHIKGRSDYTLYAYSHDFILFHS